MSKYLIAFLIFTLISCQKGNDFKFVEKKSNETYIKCKLIKSITFLFDKGNRLQYNKSIKKDGILEDIYRR